MKQKVKRRYLWWMIASICLGLVSPSGNEAHAATLFADNFEDGNSTGWTASSGTWTVVSDGSQVYKQTNSNSTAEGLVTAGSASWANYSISAKMKLNDSNATAASGIIARYQDNNNYYLLRLHAANGLQLYRKNGGAFNLIGSYSTPADVNNGTPSNWN